MTATKYVIELHFEDQHKINSISQWEMCQKIRTALKTISHKKHALPKLRMVDVKPMEGSLAAAVDLTRLIREEAEEAVRQSLWGHEDQYEHKDAYDYD